MGIREARLMAELRDADLIGRVKRIEDTLKAIGVATWTGAVEDAAGFPYGSRLADDYRPDEHNARHARAAPLDYDTGKRKDEKIAANASEAKTPEQMTEEIDEEIESKRIATLEGVSAADLASAAAATSRAGELHHEGFGRWIVTVDGAKVWPADEKWGLKTDAAAALAAL